MKFDPLPAKATATFNIGIDARGSQQLVVLLLVLAAISLAMTGYFLWHRHEMWVWLASATTTLVGVAVWSHSKSRRQLDRASARATRITPTPTGIEVETDALTLADPEAAAALERMMSAAFYRVPLPMPDGRVLAGNEVDQSAAGVREATEQVEAVNEQAIETRQRTVEMLSGTGGSGGQEVQQPSQLPPPVMAGPVFSRTRAAPRESGAH